MQADKTTLGMKGMQDWVEEKEMAWQEIGEEGVQKLEWFNKVIFRKGILAVLG